MDSWPSDAVILLASFLDSPKDYHQFRYLCRLTYSDLENVLPVSGVILNRYLLKLSTHSDAEQLLRWSPRDEADLGLLPEADDQFLLQVNYLGPGSLARFKGSPSVLQNILRTISVASKPETVDVLLRAINDEVIICANIDAIIDALTRCSIQNLGAVQLDLFGSINPLPKLEPHVVARLLVGHGKLAEELIEIGISDINEPDHVGRSLLMEAVQKNPELAIFLIERRAHVNVQDIRGNTALHHLSLKVAHALLLRGADPTIRNNFGDSAVELAERENQSELVRLF